MKVVKFNKRDGFEKKLYDDGFFYWNSDKEYWIEDEAVVFTQNEADEIVKATNEIHAMGKDFIGDVIQRGDYEIFSRPSYQLNIPEIERSWRENNFDLFGRFDMGMTKNGVPKVFEYNADTPVTYMEASKIQEDWYQDKKQNYGQFNHMREAMIKRWSQFKDKNGSKLVHMMSDGNIQEEYESCDYMKTILNQAGLEGKWIGTKNFQVDKETGYFFDADGERIFSLYKIVPWDFILDDSWGMLLGETTNVIEPAWKYLLNDKYLWALLWKKYPNHPYLLETVLNPEDVQMWTKDFVMKPAQGREGNNIQMFRNKEIESFTAGLYGSIPVIYQERCEPLFLNNAYYGIGSWVVGDNAVSIGMRKDEKEIIQNISCYVPHLIG